MARPGTLPKRPPAPPTAPGSARLRDAVREQQQRLAATFAVLDSAAVEDVHGARVAARRLRSMLRTFRPLLDERRAGRYRSRLRTFAQRLGAAREADVRRDLLRLVGDSPAIGPVGRRRLAALIDDDGRASREQLRRHLAESGWSRLRMALQRDAADDRLFAVADAEFGDLVQLAARAWRRPVKLLRRKPANTAELHELRLAFKHCRYALEPVADVAPRATKRLLRRLRAAQDRIGEHRDTVLAEHWVREHERALGRALVGRLAAVIATREETLRRQAAARAAKVLVSWRTWRDATRRVRKAASSGRV